MCFFGVVWRYFLIMHKLIICISCHFIMVKLASYCELPYLPLNVLPVPHCQELVQSFFLYLYIRYIYFFLFVIIPSTIMLLYDYVVLHSYAYHYNIPQTGWLRQTKNVLSWF